MVQEIEGVKNRLHLWEYVTKHDPNWRPKRRVTHRSFGQVWGQTRNNRISNLSDKKTNGQLNHLGSRFVTKGKQREERMREGVKGIIEKKTPSESALKTKSG